MISPLAYIHPEAKIANNVTIEPFAMVHKDTVIGEGTWIGSHACILDGARIGKNCKIFQGAIISGEPQDLKFAGEITTAEIGDNTVIREFVTINRGTTDKYKTVIGKNCLVMAYVHAGHDCIIGNNVIIGNATQLAGHVVIDDFAIFGGSCAVQQFIKIGSHSYIAGGSLIRKDIPPFVKAGREPVSYVGVNSVGLRRRGYTNEQISEIQETYRLLYLRKMNNTKALEFIENQIRPSEERDEVINFVRNSERGVMKGVYQD
jgi:UDP-N-acetylglucosamine acyltransferase